MITFNSNDICIGEIKQLLNSFNLPFCKVLVDAEKVEIFKDITYLYGIQLLKANKTKEFKNGFVFDENDFTYLGLYNYNQNILNITHTLPIKCNYYDSYTHEYLGNYLRFLRDKKELDLMRMYNCFNGKVASNTKISVNQGESKLNFTFDSSEKSYKIYTVPVKFWKKYTIAIDCLSGIEIVPAFYKDSNLMNELTVGTDNILEKYLYSTGYKKFGGCRFNSPVVYDGLYNIFEKIVVQVDQGDDYRELYHLPLFNNESELCLLIKVPQSNKSSLVVLEGDYAVDNVSYNTKNVFPKLSRVLVNYKNIDNFNDYQSRIQLLFMNDYLQHPFSERLLEYLSDNVISNIDIISNNVELVERTIKDKVINKYTKDFEWTNELRANIYLYANQKGITDKYFDILGYVDRDIEEKVVGDYKYKAELED